MFADTGCDLGIGGCCLLWECLLWLGVGTSDRGSVRMRIRVPGQIRWGYGSEVCRVSEGWHA